MVWEEHVIEGRIGGGCGGFRRYEVSAGVSRPHSFTEKLECIPALLIQLLQLHVFPLIHRVTCLIGPYIRMDRVTALYNYLHVCIAHLLIPSIWRSSKESMQNYTLTLNHIHIGHEMIHWLSMLTLKTSGRLHRTYQHKRAETRCARRCSG